MLWSMNIFSSLQGLIAVAPKVELLEVRNNVIGALDNVVCAHDGMSHADTHTPSQLELGALTSLVELYAQGEGCHNRVDM